MINEDFSLKTEVYSKECQKIVINNESQPFVVKKRKYIKKNKIGFFIKEGRFIYSFE
jgi:hypothetical protein